MISQTLQAALCEHMKNEYFSGYLYAAMSAYFNSKGLTGFEKWMHKQASEEASHGDRFLSFLKETRSNITFLPIEGPQSDFESPLAAMEYAFEHERYVSESIHNLKKMAQTEGSCEVDVFLNWFVMEQIEEEDAVATIVDRIKTGGSILLIDIELGKRE